VASLEDRGKALEEEFFRDEETKAISERKTAEKQNVSKEALRAVSGMDDEEVLDKLLDLGVSADTISALSLVPLVEVAWADGKVQQREREAILQAAHGKGIEKETPACDLLTAWLAKKPDAKLLDAWVAYVGALDTQLTKGQLAILKRQVVDRAQLVARVAGGILGLMSVSAAEKAVIAKLEAAFDARAEKIGDE